MNQLEHGDFKNRRQKDIWHFLNRLMVTLIFFAIITLLICAFIPEIKKRREQAAHLEELQADIAKQKAILNKRTREVELLRNDPTYVEIIARDRLDLMKEGETIFRLEPQEPDKSNFKLVPQ